jgi:low affinity Fe/Cu permease
MNERFQKLSNAITQMAGSPWASAIAFLLVIGWFIGGFVSGFSPGYQLIINTGTTIITFLMVFLIQSSQNRDGAALHLKIDELIRVIEGASNQYIDLEDAPLQTIKQLQEQRQREKV